LLTALAPNMTLFKLIFIIISKILLAKVTRENLTL